MMRLLEEKKPADPDNPEVVFCFFIVFLLMLLLFFHSVSESSMLNISACVVVGLC